jgi:hypothetical protein
VSNFSKTLVILTEMQQIGNKKVIHRRTSDKICNTFDYMRITFPFEPLTKIGFLRIYFLNQLSENLNLPIDIPFYGVNEKFDTDNTFL